MWTCGTERFITIRLGLALLLLALIAMPSNAGRSSKRPEVIQHKVRRGQTLAGLAVKYYRDRDRFEALARVNDIEPPYRLKVGHILRIPVSITYRVRSGDTPSGIAQRLLGGASHYPLLMEMNGLPAKGTLKQGEKLEIPAITKHKLGRGETLGGVAKRYYGDASRAGWIARYNDIARPDRVKRGTRLKIPLIGFRRMPAASGPSSASSSKGKSQKRASAGKAKKSSQAAAAKKPRKPETRSQPKKPAWNAALERAVDLYHQGDYRKAASRLDTLLQSGGLEKPHRARALRYRAYCAVATGDPHTASRTFRALHRATPSWKPDPTQDSPKIRRAFAKAISSSGS